MRTLALILLALAPLRAQFREFAVTDDGRLFFTTTLSTASDGSGSKIYRVTSSGIGLFAMAGSDFLAGPNTIQPLTSGDGSITGFGLNYPCRSGSCGLAGIPRTFFTLQGTDFTSRPYDSVQISRNARFLLGRTYDSRARRIDLQTQQTKDLPQYLIPSSNAQAISNSGAMLVRSVTQPSSPLQLIAGDAPPRIIPGTEGNGNAILSPNDTLIAYERHSETSYDLFLSDSAGAAPRLLASVPPNLSVAFGNLFFYRPSFANDGSLLYLAPVTAGGPVQPILVAPSAEPRILAIDGSVQNSILSGNGELAWVLAGSGRLLRVRTLDGGTDEFIPETPVVTLLNANVAPGSLFRLIGGPLSALTQVTLSGTSLPVTELSAGNANIQLPWEVRPSTQTMSLTVQEPGNPFSQSFNLYVSNPTMTFERTAFNVLAAAHQDFHGPLTDADPAIPGETIHIFARNLGPVDPPVATGQPSPFDPPARVTTPLGCYLSEPFVDASTPRRTDGLVVPFAGLSPGSVGVYQLDVTIPSTWTSSTGYLSCLMNKVSDANSIPIGSAR